MQRSEIDNFTTIIKHEIILKKYSDKDIKPLLIGYFFQNLFLNNNNNEIHLKFNLINDFIISKLIHHSIVKNEDIKIKNNTIYLKIINNEEYNKFLVEINEFLNRISKSEILEDEFKYFIIGWFLHFGSISNLNAKYYHLELKLKLKYLKDPLLQIFKNNHILFKFLERKSFSIFYLKKIDNISDFLKWINAIDSMMMLEDKRITNDSNNFMQRWENLDISNALKISLSNQNQLNTIKELKKNKLFYNLSNKERLICEFRLKYKDLSLSDLAEKINNESNLQKKITKSSIAYIFNKLDKLINNKDNKITL